MKHRPETFSDMLLRLIRESGRTEPDVYKAAHLTRQHFGKIKLNRHYRPKKKAIFQFAVALRLNTETTEKLLKKAGYALNDSDSFDLVMKYCLDKRILDFKTINELLLAYGRGEDVFPRTKK